MLTGRRALGMLRHDVPMCCDLLTSAERNRVAVLSGLDPKRQETLGQFFTPSQAAVLIASMPRLPTEGHLRVLDPGAGSGMLAAALVARVLAESKELSVHIVAVECDPSVVPFLEDTLAACVDAAPDRVSAELIVADYITAATGLGADERLTGFDMVIQNPPYAKLAASSPARAAVRSMGVDAPNLYAAFLALGAGALRTGGQLVAITPRSFCNGPYFGDFRRYLLEQITLDRIHVFDSRSTVFADTGVLQENVIICGSKGGISRDVMLSSSGGHRDEITGRQVPYAEVVHPDDAHRFIRIAANADDTEIAEQMLSLPRTLAALGLTASTGRVVDFRSRHCLLPEKAPTAVPLIYPANLRDGLVTWPREIRKPQWFLPTTDKDKKLLLPQGWYCVIKRFSSKEERRRIVASVWSPDAVPGPVAFENHVNVIHVDGEGLDRDLAFGLSLWLNSTLVDKFFRTFSGHTQVNATDLRTLRFPPLDVLRDLGSLAPPQLPGQPSVDSLVEQKVLDVVNKAA
ncbi:Eco57I restriction-modification methylase domain-containing protein [Nocardia sp. NPDC050697]|uniref:Eco57I restriction-modification methylase domain-containing protein n=1 Tax=Nocardia sp. NPDC050697 TaxID=3155158 RepID=UPI0033F42DDD